MAACQGYPGLKPRGSLSGLSRPSPVLRLTLARSAITRTARPVAESPNTHQPLPRREAEVSSRWCRRWVTRSSRPVASGRACRSSGKQHQARNIIHVTSGRACGSSGTQRHARNIRHATSGMTCVHQSLDRVSLAREYSHACTCTHTHEHAHRHYSIYNNHTHDPAQCAHTHRRT